MSQGRIATLADGKLYALQNPYALDGRVSSYPENARGFAVSNCYLLTQDDGALLLDTGFAAHESAIIGQLADLLDRETPLSLFPLRLNEFMSVCNAAAIAERFNVVECYSPVPDVDCWLQFDAVAPGGNGGHGRPLVTSQLKSKQRLQVGDSGKRPIEVFHAPIRLINTTWIYDAATRTLFTSDMFTHFWRDHPDGPWVVGDNDEATSADELRSFLLNTRYWWLEGAAIDELRREVADVFERYDIETVAPGYGCILRGRDIVAYQFKLLDEVLRELDRTTTSAHYVARGELR